MLLSLSLFVVFVGIVGFICYKVAKHNEELIQTEKEIIFNVERKANAKPIRCIELDITFPSITDAYIYFDKGANNGSINHCLRGDRNTAFGYHWEFIEE